MGSTPVIQTSFNAGEWAPALNARVDVQKYHSGAALLRNFFVDYRGGATTRPGSRFILPTRLTTTTRLIPFQASLTVSYVLEFGQNYIRFYNNGAPVLETGKTITGATNANPGVVTSAAHGYSNGDWIYVSGVGGMTQLNGNYYIVAGVTTNTFTLVDLFGNAINTSAFGVYTSGGTAKRVYTLLTSPYKATELANIKFAQSVNTLILCHPNYPPYQLVLNSATNWTLSAITFGATVAAPTGVAVATTLAAGSVNYSYIVTAVDANGQESGPSVPGALTAVQDIRSVLGTNTVTWSTAAGAASYNVYKAEPTYAGAVPAGAMYGFIGNCVGVSFADSNISPDFAQGIPVIQTPFTSGSGVQSLTLTAGGSGYGAPPAVSFSGGAPTTAATAYCYLGALALSVNNGGIAPYNGGVPPPATLSLGYGVVANVGYSVGFFAGIGSAWVVTSVSLAGAGVVTGSAPSVLYGPGNPQFYNAPVFNVTWGVAYLYLSSSGTGYSGAPTVVFSPNLGTAAVATVGAGGSGNPTVPGFFQQRLVLAGPPNSPQQFNFSQPGSYYNFNTNNPIEADDAIQGTLVSGQLNNIQSMIAQPQGLIMFSDKQAWLINGGSPGSPISAIQIVANTQAYNGSSILPPIVANDNILYVQSKGSIVRDLVFNFYTSVYTGADISVLSSHLFYGYSLKEWAWAEEPFKIVWAVRSDGTMLTLTFLKEQELVAWSHSDTQGSYQSVASVTEYTVGGSADAVYAIVSRVIRGQTVQYVERFVEQGSDLSTAWCVDAGIQFTGFAGPNTSPPLPQVTSLSPNTDPPGSVITINGNFFTGTVTVTFGGVTAAFTLVNVTTITATVPAGAGTVDVQVTTIYGQSALTPADQFTYVACDPSFANCVLLLGYEGANGSTGAPGYTDLSPAAHGTASVGGSASISTSQFKFGAASGFWSSAGSGVRFPPSSSWALGSAPFTLETWIRFNSLPAADAQLMGMIEPGLFGWYLHIDNTGHLIWSVSTNGSSLLNDISYAWSPTLATWYFITVDYDGTKYRMYVNGVMVGSSTTARAIFDSADFLGLGCNSIATGLFFDGWMDETRITKGVARYASDSGFAVPTAAFPRIVCP